jgi:hypothetical protein
MSALTRQPDMPDLRVVPVEQLLLHEQHDVQRSEPLARRLQADGVLRNPPVVAPVNGEQRFVVLDGANRVTAIQALGLSHIAVQVVDYGDAELVLDTWHHLVSGMAREHFAGLLQAVPGMHIEPATLPHARAQLARREALAFVEYADGGVFALHAGGNLHHRTALLNDLVDIYRSRGRIFRANTDRLDQLLPYHDDLTALVVFPRYDPVEIVDLARVGAKLPAGITRHLIPRRALRIDFPLALLSGNEPLQEKHAWLADWMKAKIAAKQVRFYEESTFLFDE